MVIRDGQEMAFAADGYADIEAGKKYERDTIARLYSMTKPVTSAAAMLLMERGLLDPGAFVEEFLPGFHNAIVASGGKLVPTVRPVRICDLLNMTSGLMYGGDVTSVCSMETEKLFDRIKEHLYLEDAMTTQEVANRLGLIPLQFQPGESFQYGTSADVLGAVIEVISGKTFGEFLKEEFFEPLDMEDTAFYVPENKQERLAKVYQRTEQGLELYTENHLGIMNAMEQVPAFESGGAGLVSTLDDYAKFASMLLQEGSYQGKQILKPQTIQAYTNHLHALSRKPESSLPAQQISVRQAFPTRPLVPEINSGSQPFRNSHHKEPSSVSRTSPELPPIYPTYSSFPENFLHISHLPYYNPTANTYPVHPT